MSTLVAEGVDTCFMNPGTSEMHFVAALDHVPAMHGVLALFEGVATGAADGYARVAGRPAAALVHLGPGLANGLANLHNARRAHSPVVAVVGDHALSHQRYDAPLQSDIASLARPMSGWLRASTHSEHLADDVVEAVRAANGPPGQVATLVVPADLSWSEAPAPAPHGTAGTPTAATVAEAAVTNAATALRSGRGALLVGGRATGPAGLRAASRVAEATGAKLLCETFPANLHRGAGLPPVERLGYLAEFAEAQLQGMEHLMLVDAAVPVSFFAYPGRRSLLAPEGCAVHQLAAGPDDVVGALEALAESLGAPARGVRAQPASRPALPSGALDARSAAAVIGALLPEGAVVSDEANTSGVFVAGATAGCPPHQWLCLTGGAIGQGLPVATGAAVAAPGAKVLCLQADGSAMYTLQALWTQARQELDVTTVVFNNGSYAVLEMELDRVGAQGSGARARDMLDLSRPDLDFVALARGMGVAASRATTAEELADQVGRALADPGPAVVEAMVGRII